MTINCEIAFTSCCGFPIIEIWWETLWRFN